MSNIVKNQAVKLYNSGEPLFNDTTSRCVWHQDYFPLITCDDSSQIIINTSAMIDNSGVDNEFNFVVTGNLDGTANSAIITDAAATFQTDNVESGMYFMLYISGANGLTGGGVLIQSVDSETQITLVSNVSFTNNDYYEISEWNYGGDVRTVNGYAEIKNDVPTANVFLRQAITDNINYKVEFTVTFIDPDAPASFMEVKLGSNSILNLFVDDIEAKKYTVFGVSDGATFELSTNGNPIMNIDDVTISQMYDTTYKILDCEDDSEKYSSISSDIVYSNSLDQLRMSIDWSNAIGYYEECTGCRYIQVKQDLGINSLEVINNGDFNGNADGWTLGVGWNYSSNRVNINTFTLVGILLTQDTLSNDMIKGLNYDLTFTLVLISGSLNIKLYSDSVEVLDMGTVSSSGNKTISTGILLSDVDEIRFITGSSSTQNMIIDNISILATLETFTYRTDCFQLADSYDCTVVLSGTNVDNAFGIDFEGLTYNPSIRVHGELMTPIYDGEKENEEDSLGISETLYFKSDEKRNLFLSQLPLFHHEFIRLLIGYDQFDVDGVEYIATGSSYEIINERVLGKLPDLSDSITEFRLKDDLNVNKFC